MRLEFHQLDRRLESLRVRHPARQRRLIASRAESGQQTPIIVIETGGRYLVIDGHKRIAALQQLGRDTVEAVVWEMSEADALVLERSLQHGRTGERARTRLAASGDGEPLGLLDRGTGAPLRPRPSFPHRTAIGDPLLQQRKFCRFDAAGADPSDLLGVHQSAFLQHLQVLNHRCQSDVEGRGQPGDRKGSFAELLYYCPPRAIAERVEHAVDVNFGRGHCWCRFRRTPRLGGQLLRQLLEQVAPSGFADLRTIGTLKECSLMCADEVCLFAG